MKENKNEILNKVKFKKLMTADFFFKNGCLLNGGGHCVPTKENNSTQSICSEKKTLK